MRACVEARALHDAGSWGRLQATEWQMLETTLLAPARKIVGAQRQAATTGEHISNDAVRAEVEFPTARALVDVARVRFAARLQKQADPSLRALLQADRGRLWRGELMSALGIMHAMLSTKTLPRGSLNDGRR